MNSFFENRKKMKYIMVSLALIFVFGFCILFALKMTLKSTKSVQTINTNATELAEQIYLETVQHYPKPIILQTPTPPPIYNANITVVGDLMVHGEQMKDAYRSETDSYDFDYGFSEISQYLSGADYTIGNLETTFAGKEIGYSDYPTFCAPDEFGQALKNAGFDMVTTANNHCNDKHEQGLLRTIDVLDSLGIEHIGTYKDQQSRDTIFMKEINNIEFVFLSYTYGTNGIPLTEGKPYLANIMSEEIIKSDLEKAKAMNPDFIVVLPHMGNEYETYPNDTFKNWTNFMFENGADIVLASHPHVLQPMEFVTVTNADGTTRECFVAYSMANFISSQRTLPRETGMILNLSFEKIGEEKAILKSVSYIPTWVKYTDTGGGRDIKVLSVYDKLNAYAKGEDTGLREKDIARLKDVHYEISDMMLGREVPLEEMQNEYFLKE